jgi:hypothetical protein
MGWSPSAPAPYGPDAREVLWWTCQNRSTLQAAEIDSLVNSNLICSKSTSEIGRPANFIFKMARTVAQSSPAALHGSLIFRFAQTREDSPPKGD